MRVRCPNHRTRTPCSTPDVEAVQRDAAIARAVENPGNHFYWIAECAAEWVDPIPAGQCVVAGEVFKAVMKLHPHLRPDDKRVMGAVMRRLQSLGLVRAAGISTRERSHKGNAREWRRTTLRRKA